MKCGNCGQDILQAHPEICPYCKSKNLIAEEDTKKEVQQIDQLAKSGRYEEAALRYEKMDLWSDAKACRILAKKKKHTGAPHLETGKLGAVSMVCPHCGESQPLAAKATEVVCNKCGTTYAVPQSVLGLIETGGN